MRKLTARKGIDKMHANASLVWLESMPKTSSSTSEEQLLAKLFINSCQALGVESKKISVIQDLEASPKQNAQSVVLIAGEAGDRNRMFFLDLGNKLRRSGANPIFVIDALTGMDHSKKRMLINHLDREQFHVATQETAMMLLKTPLELLQSFPKAEISSNLIVYLPVADVIVMYRQSQDSSQEALRLPGGYLRPFAEDLASCAAREFCQQSGITINSQRLELVDVRSKPDTNKHSHSVDHYYLYVIKPEEESSFRHALKESSESSRLELVNLHEAVHRNLCEDLQSILEQAQALIKNILRQTPFLSIEVLAVRCLRWIKNSGKSSA